MSDNHSIKDLSVASHDIDDQQMMSSVDHLNHDPDYK